MIVRIEAFIRKLWRVFSPEEWMARLLNLPKAKDSAAKPGLVMVQIDGLGFTQFERAIQKGSVPFLTRLWEKEGYTNRRHYTGLPSNTPAVQAQLFYGVKNCVPAFSFKDSRSGEVFNMFNPESASAVEDRLKDRGAPLLKGGSAYGNIFTGGANEAHFCVSSIGWGSLLSLLKAASPLGMPLVIFLNLHIFIRALFLILVELILAVVDSIRGIISGKKFMSEIGYIPLRAAVCVLLREVIVAGAKIDIARGLPVIHINLAGYDEQAHHRGPQSAFAHWSLRGIDSATAKVWKAAQRAQQRHYDVFVYSDHGQENTTSYHEEYGRTIDEAVNEIFKKQTSSGLWRLEFSQGYPYWRAHTLRNRPEKKREAGSSRPEAKESDATLRVVVAAMGNVGLIYPPQPLSPEEKEALARDLVLSAKVPFVMTKDGPGRAIAWNTQGKYIFPEEADKVIEASHPFFEDVTHDLVELCHHPDAGELLIFGWRKGSKSLTFHTEQGSHAGPGPEETSGFALLPMGALARSSPPKRAADPPLAGICTQDLRNAAFRAQGACLPAGRRGDENISAIPESTVHVTDPPNLRIMTYNVHACMGRDGKISPNRIAGIIARHDPDIIALQELGSSEQAHQAEVIAKKLVMACHFHPCLSMKKGQRGNAIFSKFSMRLVRNGSLPKLHRMPFLESRGALWVEIDVRGVKIQVLTTHLSLSSRERLLQMKALLGLDWLGSPSCPDPVIFCGDFNALARSKIFKNIGPKLKNTHLDLNGYRFLKTLPSFYPLGLVDHIFVGPRFKTTKIEVPKTALEKMASDHLPLIVDVQIG